MAKRVRAPVLDDKGVHIKYKTGAKAGHLKYRWELPCENCHKTFPQAQVETDHIEPAGGCSNAVEAGTFLYRLLVSSDKLRLVCKPCHKIITYAERYGLSFAEAAAKKRVIELLKKPIDRQKKELLSFGFVEKDITNKNNRGKAYSELIERGDL